MNKKYLELTKLIRSKQNDHEILKCLSNYHENDIADMLTVMTPKERKRIYTLLEPQKIAEIFAYLDEPQIYFSELSVKDAAKVVSLMDSDDAGTFNGCNLCDALIFEVFRKSFPDVLHQYRIYLMIDKTVYF